jgi:hypothetical protein
MQMSSKIQNHITGSFNACSSHVVLKPGWFWEIHKSTFSHRGGLFRMAIPSSVTFIGTEAFRDCEALREVTLPSALEGVAQETGRDRRAMGTGLP